MLSVSGLITGGGGWRFFGSMTGETGCFLTFCVGFPRRLEILENTNGHGKIMEFEKNVKIVVQFRF